MYISGIVIRTQNVKEFVLIERVTRDHPKPSVRRKNKEVGMCGR